MVVVPVFTYFSLYGKYCGPRSLLPSSENLANHINAQTFKNGSSTAFTYFFILWEWDWGQNTVALEVCSKLRKSCKQVNKMKGWRQLAPLPPPSPPPPPPPPTHTLLENGKTQFRRGLGPKYSGAKRFAHSLINFCKQSFWILFLS